MMIIGPEVVEASYYEDVEEFLMYHRQDLLEGWTRLLRISRAESTAIMRLADRWVTDILPYRSYTRVFLLFQFL